MFNKDTKIGELLEKAPEKAEILLAAALHVGTESENALFRLLQVTVEHGAERGLQGTFRNNPGPEHEREPLPFLPERAQVVTVRETPALVLLEGEVTNEQAGIVTLFGGKATHVFGPNPVAHLEQNPEERHRGTALRGNAHATARKRLYRVAGKQLDRAHLERARRAKHRR